MIKSIDHIVILVQDLTNAVTHYNELGFTSVAGGEHSDGSTHNALVAFADGTYLELIAFKRPSPQHRWWQYQTLGEGLVDFALLPTAITQDIETARKAGLEMQGPFPGGRARPDGQQLEWQTALPPTHALPFLCGDVTPREWRVPGADSWIHANGVRGIAQVSVLVKNLAASVAQYQALLGHEPLPQNADHEVNFSIGTAIITLIEPKANTEAEMKAHLEKHGEGPYKLLLQTNSGQISIQ